MLLHLLTNMWLCRHLDRKMELLIKQNKGGTFFLSDGGHELVGVVAASYICPKKDFSFPYHRDRAFVIGLGASIEELLAAHLARDIPTHSGGRMMPDHFCDKNLNIVCQSSCVASQFLQAVGVAKSLKMKGEGIVYVSGGDGATSEGDFHEALNFASIHKLPILFVIQDNGFAISTPINEQTAGGSIIPLVKGYLKTFEVDGTNFVETDKAFSEATRLAKEGPVLILAKVPRLGAHSCSDDPTKYKSRELILEEKAKDPLPLFEKYLLQEGLTLDDLLKVKEKTKLFVEEAAIAAEKKPFPKKEDVKKHLFLPFSVSSSLSPSTKDVTMIEAINHALLEEMERDPSILVFGEDVAKKGGVFGVTRGLFERFEKRCFNTPLAESTIIGIAIGLSINGYKPVAEIQFMDYVWSGINQIVNELSSIHYRSKGMFHCPVVIRMPYGGYIQGGPYHSQSLEAIFCHVPGLKVVVPSNAQDAKRLLKTAIRDPNPVLFLEHKGLYRDKKASSKEPSKEDLLSFGEAQLKREGKDITIVAWGLMVHMAEAAAACLAKEGIDPEILDLRTLNPLDIQAILSSLKKTGRLLIVHEAWESCGFGAEIAARVAKEGFSLLKAPIERVAAKECPIPYSHILEGEVLPKVEDIIIKAKDILEYNRFQSSVT